MKKRKILIILSWPFFDGLTLACQIPYCYIMRQYLNADDEIYIHTEEKNDESIKSQGALQLINELKQKNIFIVPQPYKKMGLMKIIHTPINLVKLIYFVFKNKINLVMCNGMTAGMIATIVATITNRKLILDGCEPHAECMVESGTWQKNSLAFKVLSYFEKRQLKKAKAVLGSVVGLQNYSKEKYGVEIENFNLRPSCVNINLFTKLSTTENEKLREALNFKNKIVCIYVGKFGSQYLDIEIFEFFKECINKWGNKFSVLILTPHTKTEIENYCNQVNIDINIFTILFVPHNEVPKYLSIADFAINPVRPIPSNKFCSPIKDGEYWAMGLPVIITKDISEDSDIIEKENIGAVLYELNEEHYKKAINKISILLIGNTDILADKIRNVAIKHRSYDIAHKAYKNIFTTLDI